MSQTTDRQTTDDRDDRQTDGRATANGEREVERESTFANNFRAQLRGTGSRSECLHEEA